MIAPAIHFKDNCLQAIEFYEKAFDVSDKQIFSPMYASVKDRFGVQWQIMS